MTACGSLMGVQWVHQLLSAHLHESKLLLRPHCAYPAADLNLAARMLRLTRRGYRLCARACVVLERGGRGAWRGAGGRVLVSSDTSMQSVSLFG